MKVFTRYLLLQIPGTLGLLLVMAGLHLWLDVSVWIGMAVLALWVAKDLALYPLLRPAFERGEHLTPHSRMVGETGVAEQDLDPEGFVRVRGELWRAVTADGARVPRGDGVRVNAVEGSALVVARLERPSSRPSSSDPTATSRRRS